jgi:hypothetical protein
MFHSLERQASSCVIVHTCGAKTLKWREVVCVEENWREMEKSADWSHALLVHQKYAGCGYNRSTRGCIFLFDYKPQMVASHLFLHVGYNNVQYVDNS